MPSDQVLLLTDEGRARLTQSIPEYLGKITAENKLVVFFTGRAYKDSDGKVYLAPKDFDPARISETGVALQWLVDELEKCPAKEKLLLLDGGHAGAGADLAMEPSSEEMLGSLKAPPGRGPLRTVTAIASCKAGQRSVDWPEKQHGLFAWLVAQGYSGAADKNHDNRVESTELLGYLQDAMAAAGGPLKALQTPAVSLADDRPLRLPEEAKTAIRKLATYVHQDRIKAADAKADYEVAAQAAGKEPEPRLLYGLLLLKSRQREVSAKYFDDLASQFPNALLPLQAIAWLQFDWKRTYQSGVEELTKLVSKIPKPKKPNDSYQESELQVLSWAGQLREFATIAAEEGKRPSADSLASLDAAVAKHGPEAVSSYEEGRTKSARSATISRGGSPSLRRMPRASTSNVAAPKSSSAPFPTISACSRSSPDWTSDTGM